MKNFINWIKNIPNFLKGLPAKPMNENTPQPISATPENTPKPVVDMITKWAHAIARWEGADSSLNNPGDLKLSTLTKTWGAMPGFQASDGGWIAKFETFEKGFLALVDFLTLGAEDELLAFHQSRTLQLFMEKYAGNPPQSYIQGIATDLGVPLSTDVSTFLS